MQLPSWKILWPSLNGFIGKFGLKTPKPQNPKTPWPNSNVNFLSIFQKNDWDMTCKIWVSWPLHIVFRSMNSKTCFFGAIFGFWGQISLWSRLGRATKFYMKEVALIRNFHVKFEGIPTIFVVTMKKNRFIFHFRGPFWALLGTPW